MLCGIYDDSSHPQYHRRFFRGLRSRRNLNNYDDSRPAPAMSHRPRLPSDASSLASSRPSISNRSDLSVDWDPLRLHPPLAPGPAPPLRDDGATRSSRASPPRELRHARSSHTLGRPSSPPSPSPPPPSQRRQHSSSSASSSRTVIYDGFDFGFGGEQGKPTRPAPGSRRPTGPPRSHRRRAPSPTPSEDSVFSSNSSTSTSSGSDDLDLSGLSPRPRPRPRPRHRLVGSEEGGGSGSLLDDDAEYFIRRGGWKRRGIVFVEGASLDAEEVETGMPFF